MTEKNIMDVDADDDYLNFHEMGLDDRILEAIARLKWKEPTPIQQKAIQYFLEGKDISAEARTGSGKTGAFVIPLIHRILECKQSAHHQVVRAMILAPSKELSRQISDNIKQMTVSCGREVRHVDVAEQMQVEAVRPLLLDNPDIVIGTPLRVLAHINAGHLNLQSSLQFLVIDEADLMFQYDHKSDIELILKKLPKIYQSFLTSATMNHEVKQLKKLVLHNPVGLKLEEPPLPVQSQLAQYVLELEEFDKALLLYSLFRLNMVHGKTIVFVNCVDKVYKLFLFLQQFDVSSCVLNSEKPAESRCHIVEQFNKGVYNIIIASDEATICDPGSISKQQDQKKSKRKKDKESGVSRGVDFQFVSNIINYDFPTDLKSYIHRVGRTARGNNSGIAISLVSSNEQETYQTVKKGLRKVMESDGEVLKNFKFDFNQVHGFRYRAQDAWRRCTKILITETRKNDIRNELLNAVKLKSHFVDNPQDLQVLRNIKQSRGLTSMPHLKNVQDYMLSDNLRKVSKIVKKRKKTFNKNAPKRTLKSESKGESSKQTITKGRMKYLKKKNDPLKSMQFSGFKAVM